MLGGRLWHGACRRLNEDLPDSVPLSFTDAAEYVGTFEPLLFEEARECVRSDWGEACEGARPRTWPAAVSRSAAIFTLLDQANCCQHGPSLDTFFGSQRATAWHATKSDISIFCHVLAERLTTPYLI